MGKKADMPTERFGLAFCTANGKIYAIGGANKEMGQNDYVGLSIVEEYDPATDTWIRKADMPTARYALSAVSINGKIYAIGGRERSVDLDTLEEYDPETDKWTKKTDMPRARCIFGAAAVDGKIYALGGYNGIHLSNVDEYDTGLTDESAIEGK